MMIKPATHCTHAVTALLIKHEISHEAKLTLANKLFFFSIYINKLYNCRLRISPTCHVSMPQYILAFLITLPHLERFTNPSFLKSFLFGFLLFKWNIFLYMQQQQDKIAFSYHSFIFTCPVFDRQLLTAALGIIRVQLFIWGYANILKSNNLHAVVQ